MPLTELMFYFNDQLRQVEAPQLPKTGFYFADNQYWARFGSQVFGNRFKTLYSTVDNNILGYDSALWVRSALGNIITADAVFDALLDLADVVFLDRITRTLQSLNYLQQYPRPQHLLSLAVQPRHILGVPSGHGKTFEAILSDCGLATAKVLLHTRLPQGEHLAHFRQALLSYRAWGYRLGIQVHQQNDWALLKEWEVVPDYIYICNDAALPDDIPGTRAFLNGAHFIKVAGALEAANEDMVVREPAENGSKPESPSEKIADPNIYTGYLA